MTNNTIKVPGRLETIALDNKLAGANQIFDDSTGLFQEEINSMLENSITEHVSDSSIHITENEKNKLATIKENAEPNVQADWTENDSTSDAYILNKPDLSQKADKGEMSITVDGDKTTIQLKNSLSATVINAHQDISGKADSSVVSLIEAKIPQQASSSNQLADKQYVRESIEIAASDYKGTFNVVKDLSLTSSATESDVIAVLDNIISPCSENDYCYIKFPTSDDASTEISKIDYYIYKNISWRFSHHLDFAGFTHKQWSAIDSSITSQLVSKIIDMPSSDDLETLLDKKANKSEMIITPGTGANSDTVNIQLKNDTSVNVLVEHQDISGKVDKVNGKGLSTNDYTTEDRNKLANLENYDDSYIREDINAVEQRLDDAIQTTDSSFYNVWYDIKTLSDDVSTLNNDMIEKYNQLQDDYLDRIDTERESRSFADASITSYVTNKFNTIDSLIPVQASPSNKLADKDYVNDSISTATATYRGSYNVVTDLSLTVSATHAQIETALGSKISVSDNNDYAYVQIPTSDVSTGEIARIERYKKSTTQWLYEYTIVNSGFTSAQWAAINSSITSGLVAKLADLPTNAQLTALLDGKQEKIDDLANIRRDASAGASAYHKPQDGIPTEDLDSSVRTALNKANTAVQPSDIDGKANKSEMIITPGTGVNSDKVNIQLKNDTSVNVLVSHQNIPQSDWTESDTNSKAYILHKPSALPAQGGDASNADKLKTTRTLWSQPFDGSANVQGDIKDAENIEMNGVLSGARGEIENWNQLVYNGNFTSGTARWYVTSVASMTVSNNILTVSLSGGNAWYSQLVSHTLINNIISGHIYLMSLLVKGDTLDAVRLELKAFGDADEQSIVAGQWNKVAFVQKATSSSNEIRIAPAPNHILAAGAQYMISEVILIDLTAMFGEGNEPSTPAEFARRLGYASIDDVPYIPFKSEAQTVTDAVSFGGDLIVKENIVPLSGKLKVLGDLEFDNQPQNLILITHSELVALRDNSQLIPGQFYQITDYITTTCQPHTRSVGMRFDIIVQAIAKDTLAVDAITTAHDFHCNEEGYSSEINPYTGVAYSKTKDQYNADAFWHGIYDRPFTEHSNEGNHIKYYIDGKGIYYNSDREIYGYAWPYYWLGTEKYILVDRGSDFIKRYQYVGETTIDGSIYYEWSAYDQVYTTSVTPQLGDTIYDNTGTALTYSLYRYIELAHKGVIVEMEDKFHNVCGYDFKNIQYERDADFVAVYGTLCTIRSGYSFLTNTEDYDGYYYTFNVWYSNYMYNASFFIINEGNPVIANRIMAHNNKIPAHYHMAWSDQATGYKKLYDGCYQLPNNIFFSLWHGSNYGSDTDTYITKDTILDNKVRDNTFGAVSKVVIQNSNFYNNVIEIIVATDIKASKVYNCAINRIVASNITRQARAINNTQGYMLQNSSIKGRIISLNFGTFQTVYGGTTGVVRVVNCILDNETTHVSINKSITSCILYSVFYTNIDYTDTTTPEGYTIKFINGTEENPININLISQTPVLETVITTNSNGDVVQYCPADFYSLPMTTAEIDDEVDKITINN